MNEMIILLIAIYLVSVILSFKLNKYLYKKDKYFPIYCVEWFLPIFNTFFCIFLLGDVLLTKFKIEEFIKNKWK